MEIREEVNLSLSLIKHQNMEIIWEWRYSSMYPYPQHYNDVSFTHRPIYLQERELLAAILKRKNLSLVLGIQPR